MKIDVFQDPACPWCRIGKRHLQLALEQWHGEPVEVHYRGFMLNPSIPAEGQEFRPYMQAKGGGRIPLEQFFAAPRQMGSAVGLVFNFDQIERAPNMLLAQRLVAITPTEQRGALLDAIYAAYFEHGRDIGDIETLVEIAAAHGMDPAAAREQLAGDAGRIEVLADLRWAQEAGIGGVPFFVFDERYAVSGAQPPDVLLQVMEQVAAGTIAEPDAV